MPSSFSHLSDALLWQANCLVTRGGQLTTFGQYARVRHDEEVSPNSGGGPRFYSAEKTGQSEEEAS
jgi:hypothetical protein